MIRARRPFTALYYLHRVTALFPVCSGVIPRREMARHVFSFPPQSRPPSPPRAPTTPGTGRQGRVRMYLSSELAASLLSLSPYRGLNVEAERGRVGGIFLLSPARCTSLDSAMFFPARRRVYGAFLLAQKRAGGCERARARAFVARF